MLQSEEKKKIDSLTSIIMLLLACAFCPDMIYE